MYGRTLQMLSMDELAARVSKLSLLNDGVVTVFRKSKVAQPTKGAGLMVLNTKAEVVSLATPQGKARAQLRESRRIAERETRRELLRRFQSAQRVAAKLMGA